MSKDTTAVQTRGFFWLKPFTASVMIGGRAVVVERKGLNPCCQPVRRAEGGVTKGRRRRSRILIAGDKKEIGR
jgi:hypothetical protein